MHQNPDYAKLFRGRPLRFVLPLKKPEYDILPDANLIAEYAAFRKPETNETRKKNLKNGGTKTLKSNKNNQQRDIFERKSAAFKLPNSQIFVKPGLLCDVGCETPRINYEFKHGKEYQYFYAISSDVDIENPGTVSIYTSSILVY